MFALPPKAHFTDGMLSDSQNKQLRPGLANLDINQYLLWKYGRGAYAINPKPPARTPIKIVRKR